MFFEGKTVLVAGAAGFVGTHFVEELLKRGARVRATVHRRPLIVRDPRVEIVQGDLTRAEDCAAACRGAQIVVQAAGSVGAAGVGASAIMDGIAANLALNARLLQAAWNEGCDRMLVFSSSSGYPPSERAVREEEFWQGPTYASPAYFGYGWMRRYLERLAEFAGGNSKLGVAIVRPSAIYGRWDNFDPATSHVIPGLIRRAVAREDPFEVWGSGNEVRDFLHVTDLVRGCLLALEKQANAEPINIGYGESVTIREVVTEVLKAAGHASAKVVFNAEKPTAMPVRIVDVSKAKRVLDFRPSVMLAAGLADTVEWYRSLSTARPQSDR